MSRTWAETFSPLIQWICLGSQTVMRWPRAWALRIIAKVLSL